MKKQLINQGRSLIAFIGFTIGTLPSFGQDPAGISEKTWVTKPFGDRVFIENKGQMPEKIGKESKILFNNSESRFDMLFTQQGLTYKIKEVYMSEKDKKEIMRENEVEMEEIAEKTKLKYHYLHMEWLGSNPDAQVISEEPVSYYFTYLSPVDHKTGIKTSGYKKITYKNIYPGIDAEYTLPEKGGIKYSLVVHPGADISNIKIKYNGADNLNLNAEGGVEINSNNCGTYLEHTPETYYEEGGALPSSFSLQNGIIGFNVPSYDKTKTIVIDPWVKPITFPVSAVATYTAQSKTGYDVNYDNNGNVWVYGGGDPLQLAKYDNGGNLKWILQVPDTGEVVGDFDVNKISGTSYVSEGYWNHMNVVGYQGAIIAKVDANGNPGTIYPGYPRNQEISRIRLDCNGVLYTTGGGVPSGLWRVSKIDTNLVTMTGQNTTTSTNGDHDMNLMTLDPSGKYMYVNFNRPAPGSADFNHDNEMQRVTIPGLAKTWTQNGPTHHFVELRSMLYAGKYANPGGPSASRLNMFNGMVCGNGYLYTYNGDTLKQWDKTTGAFIKEVRTGGKRHWTGGIDLDLCENIYCSIGNAVKVFDDNLNPIQTYALSDTSCYDLKVDKYKKVLYATGNGYVQKIDINPPPVVLTTSVTPAGCGCTGTATANVGCNNRIVAFTYKWLPGGQTTATITAQCPGTYTVITESIALTCSKIFHDTATATIVAVPGSVSATTNSLPAKCGNNDGSATVNVTTGTAPYTYSWSPSGGNSSAATGLSAGTYSVTTTDAVGCSTTNTVVVPSSGNLTATITATNATCGMSNGASVVTAISGTSPYQYAWSPSGGNSSATSGLSPGNYTATVTDGAGCKNTQTVTITDTQSLSVNTNSAPGCIFANATASPNGGSAPFTYAWSNGQTTSVATNLTAGTYTAVITDAGGCVGTQTVSVTVLPLPTAQFIPSAPCLGSNTTLVDGSVSSPTDPINSWSWSMPGGTPSTSTNQNTTAIFNTAGTHTVTLAVTTQAGCKDTIDQQVLVYNPPIANFVGGDSGCAPICVTSFNSNTSTSADGAITGWAWSFPGGNPSASNAQNPSPICYNGAGTYSATLIVTTQYGCKDTVPITPVVHTYAWPKADFCVSPDKQPTTNPVFDFCNLWNQNSGITEWKWDFGDGTVDSVNMTPTHSYSASATQNDFYNYSVCLYVKNKFGCWDTICKSVELTPEFTFYIPNTFTPNDDNFNQFFFGKGRGIKEYNIWVFDRWGNFIWDCHYDGQNTDWDSPGQDGMPAACKWDGVVVKGGADMNGNSREIAQEDVYVWKVALIDIFDKHHSYIGHVNIVK